MTNFYREAREVCFSLLRFIKYWNVFVHRRREWLHNAAITERWPGLIQALPSKFHFDTNSDFKLGTDTTIGPFSEIVVLRSDKYSPVAGKLIIGDRTFIGAQANLRAAGGSIEIGDDVLIAQQVSIVASNHGTDIKQVYNDQRWDQAKAGVSIQNNVWIGAGCVILPGVTVAEGAIIAAGAVVTQAVPTFELWGGIPARCLKRLKS